MNCDLCEVEIEKKSFDEFETKMVKKELDVCNVCFKNLKKFAPEQETVGDKNGNSKRTN